MGLWNHVVSIMFMYNLNWFLILDINTGKLCGRNTSQKFSAGGGGGGGGGGAGGGHTPTTFENVCACGGHSRSPMVCPLRVVLYNVQPITETHITHTQTLMFARQSNFLHPPPPTSFT